MIELKSLKQHIIFISIISLFVITVVTCAIVFVKYQNVLTNQSKEEEDKLFEISLPVIEWGKYENLSKKFQNGSIK